MGTKREQNNNEAEWGLHVPKKLNWDGYPEVFVAFLPQDIQKRIHFNERKSEMYKQMLKDPKVTGSSYSYVGTVFRKTKNKNNYTEDTILRKLLDEAGFDLDELDKKFCLTPADDGSVYRDFVKYIQDVDCKTDATEFGEAQNYLYNWKKLVKRNPKIMNIDQVLPSIDRSKSPSLFMNYMFKNKGECIDNEEFQRSFVVFLYMYLKQQAIPLWAATWKEEMRDTNKVLEGKIRSFIIGSIYLLLLSHILNYDLDMLIAENWEEMRTGMGMSLFYGDYDRKIRHLVKCKCDFADASKWDSRMQYFLARIECDVNNAVYGQRFQQVSDLLGSWDKHRIQMGLPDYKIDTHRLRHMITYDSIFSFCVLPNGEIVQKERGQNSGDGRTTPRNTCVHKLVDFQSVVKVLPEKVQFRELWKVHKNDHLGDDILAAIIEKLYTLKDWRESYKNIMTMIGWEVAFESKSTSIFDTEYLSSKPIEFRSRKGRRFVPLVNSNKVVASLASKTKVQSPAMALQRVSAARRLCLWDETTYPRLTYVSDRIVQDYSSDTSKEFRDAVKTVCETPRLIAASVGSFD